MNREEAVNLLDAWNKACRAVRSGPWDLLAEAQKRGEELYDQIIAALCEDKWIPIAGLPEPYKDFLVWLPLEDHRIEIGYFIHESGKDWYRGEDERVPLSAVSHYRPLPEGPREED